MGILSTGEKIKRARIYKGYTLKDLCGDKISISKMSCIENDKIRPEDWVLDFVADKLEIDSKYLKQNVKNQIIKNMEEIKKQKYSSEYEEKLEYNLKYSEKYSYFDISFNILHLLFNYYLDGNKVEKIQLIYFKYYEYWKKCSFDENEIIYLLDIARFFYSTKEFHQAADHYNNVRKLCKASNDNQFLIKATYNEASCYVMMGDYEKAYNIAINLINLIHYIESNIKKAKVYHMLAILSLRKNIDNFQEYEQKSNELYEDNLEMKAMAMYDYAVIMFSLGSKDKAIGYTNKALEFYPHSHKDKLVKFMLMNIHKLIENNVLDKAKDICGEALDYAINLDNIMFIERAYHCKALILEKEGDFIAGEMYMNLSLDSLLKFAGNSEVYKRYMEMGNMYHNMGNIAESIKYFNFAIQLEKEM